MMNKKFIKIGSVIVLVLGLIFSLLLVAGLIFLFILFPDANIEKKAMVAALLVITLLLVCYLSVMVYDAFKTIIEMDQEIIELEKAVKKLEEKEDGR